MFRLLLIFISFPVLTFSNYSKTLQYYNAAQYKQAIHEAKASKASYSNPKLHLIWAMSAEKLGDLNDAMSAYERVLLLDKSNTQAQTALKSIYKKTKRYKLLNKDFSTGNNKLHAQLALSLGFDNNLDATPDSDTLQDYFGDIVDINKTSASFIRLTASLTYTNDFQKNGAWYSKYTLKGYAQNNNMDADFYNLKTFSLSTGLGYRAQAYNLYIPISYHSVNYLGKNLLTQTRINPNVLIPIDEDKIFDINVIYSQNKYISSKDKIKDDTTYGIEMGNYFLNKKDYISTHIKYEHHSAINGFPSKYIGANFWTLKLGTKQTLSTNIFAAIQYRFRYGEYDDVVGTTVTTRDDNFHQLDIKLSYQWSKQSHLFIADTYSENKSNYPGAVYQKNAIFAGIGFIY